ncbi:MAG: DUF2235 domain-containing protein [Candidatus Thiodiazotropha sp.]
MQANGEFNSPEYGQPFTIRFMGLFDSVSTHMVDGSATNSCEFLHDFTISNRVEYVAHAYALNEHRFFFPQDSIGLFGVGDLSNNRVEQGFIGAHSDVDGGYNKNNQNVTQNGDLSDVTLQWMVNQAVITGVKMGNLSIDHRTISNPIVHDSGGNLDREVRFPNDTNWNNRYQLGQLYPGDVPPTVYQRDDILYYQM